jgi:hypothetical protein
MKSACQRAVERFLDTNQQCAFVDNATGIRCINTKNGHAKGHQGSLGTFLADGYFVSSDFDASRFLENIESFVRSALKDIVDKNMDHNTTVNYLAKRHQRILQSAPDREFWFPKTPRRVVALFRAIFGRLLSDLYFSAANDPCYGCLFGRPEYKLPCGHYICQECLIDFDQKEKSSPYHITLHLECVYCGNPTLQQGYKVPVRPQTSGLRILSLDGGGVRGIIQLVTLRRLESLINLGLPLGQFFDLIVGTSAGKITPGALEATSLLRRGKGITLTVPF